jgi:hypothetical protein
MSIPLQFLNIIDRWDSWMVKIVGEAFRNENRLLVGEGGFDLDF